MTNLPEEDPIDVKVDWARDDETGVVEINIEVGETDLNIITKGDTLELGVAIGSVNEAVRQVLLAIMQQQDRKKLP